MKTFLQPEGVPAPALKKTKRKMVSGMKQQTSTNYDGFGELAKEEVVDYDSPERLARFGINARRMESTVISEVVGEEGGEGQFFAKSPKKNQNRGGSPLKKRNLLYEDPEQELIGPAIEEALEKVEPALSMLNQTMIETSKNPFGSVKPKKDYKIREH
jgi:hypothetical protein